MSPMPRRWPGFLAVVATYVQFLLWAQFGFLTLLKSRLESGGEVQVAMSLMGSAGLATSLVTAALLGRMPGRRLVAWGLAASGIGAVAALPAEGGWLFLAAAWIGAATATTTVALAAELGSLLPGPRFGLAVGAATGLAYFLCNLPFVFSAPPAGQALAVAVFCGLGAWGLERGPLAKNEAAVPEGAPLDLAWATPRGLVGATLALLLLVGLDSAAFAWIQATPGFKLLTWGGGWLKPIQGTTHLVAAIAAGVWLDRGRVSTLLVSSWVLFAAAFTLLGLTHGTPLPSAIAGPLYAVGISFYSVVLVVLPASGGALTLKDGLGGSRSARSVSASGFACGAATRLRETHQGRRILESRWRAAVLFGIAGWIGSGLGVGMAQDLGRIPKEVLLSAGVLLTLGLLLARSGRPRELRPPAGVVPALGGFLVFAVPAALASLTPPLPPSEGASLGDAIARGRQVYLTEGCIHCHSQYVRPGSSDESRWGAHRPLNRSEQPVLIGNRRQGPDLANVGNRRHNTWQRIHLLDPRAFSPSSSMPSYAHLFDDGGQRGADLVAYLGSLGRESPPSSPEAGKLPQGSKTSGAALFRARCAACHGESGRGDGRFAAELALPAVNLTKPDFWFVREDLDAEARHQALAEIIWGGIPGTPMPGHETLSSQELADITAFVATLPGSSANDPGALPP